MTSVKSNFRFTIFFVFIGIILISLVSLRFAYFVSTKRQGQTLYEINVDSFNKTESYMTSSYTIDKETGCIKFKDELNLTHIVCNNYTITEY